MTNQQDTALLPVAEGDRHSLSHPEQMADAQAQCVPCKLCGGKALITDAGTGAGYYIACENGSRFNASDGCLINERRLGGWAYNVMEWWNRLHAQSGSAAEQAKPSASQVERVARAIDSIEWKTIDHWWPYRGTANYDDRVDDMRARSMDRARAAITALRANAPEQAGEGMAEKINAASFAQLWVNYGDVKAERDELREALTRADACLRRPGAADHRVIQALAYTALSSGAGDEG